MRTIAFVLLVSLFFATSVLPQNGSEVLVDLETLPAAVRLENKHAGTSPLTLPFFDDFSYGSPTPTFRLWGSSGVLVNSSYAVNPPNVGVATFDAINSSGRLYPNAGVNAFPADTLASLPINLNFPADTNIYLSFQFQPQGLGNQPQTQDSLMLEFYNPVSQKWVKAWAASVNFTTGTISEKNYLLNRTRTRTTLNLNRKFFRVHFPILHPDFLSSQFRFRFRNLASIAANTHVPSLRGNSDHWHIDNIYLNRNRNFADTLLNDVAFSRSLGPMLKNYASIPWPHFNQAAQQNELTNPLGFRIHYRNQGPVTWNVTRQFSIENLITGQEFAFTGAAENIFPYQDIDYTRNYVYTFNSSSADSAIFRFTSFLITDFNPETHHLRWNDTLRYTQTFTNYYAYDDGSAENGYGLYGEGTQNGRVAYKFTSYKTDQLVGVYIYFNRTLENANQKFFKLAVWADNNGKPGQQLYEQPGLRPIFTDELNKFALYRLDEPIQIPAGTFYVGWIQTTADFLNVGFDLNRNNSSKLFYNITGAWTNTQFEGSLMLRPVFGKLNETPTGIDPMQEQLEFALYPNPAQSSFSLTPTGLNSEVRVQLFNISGQQVYHARFNGEPIAVGHLPAGVYLVRLTLGNGPSRTKKLIISK